MSHLENRRALHTLLIVALAFLLGIAGPAFAADPVGTITLKTGRATAASTSGGVRVLDRGSVVYEGEILATGPNSYLNIRFKDGGRVLLRPNSRFAITRFRFQGPEAHAEASKQESSSGSATQKESGGESAFFSLLKGGFRAISGLIGHVNHQNYRVRTPVATIGIRGTDYEARLCQGDCSDVSPAAKNGLYTAVDKGGIVVANNAGQIVTAAGQFSYVSGVSAPAVPLALRPPALGNKPLPNPANCGN